MNHTLIIDITAMAESNMLFEGHSAVEDLWAVGALDGLAVVDFSVKGEKFWNGDRSDKAADRRIAGLLSLSKGSSARKDAKG